MTKQRGCQSSKENDFERNGRRTGYYYWLAQILQHEAQGRASVSQAVGTVEDNKSVKQPVIAKDSLRNFCPTFTVNR